MGILSINNYQSISPRLLGNRKEFVMLVWAYIPGLCFSLGRFTPKRECYETWYHVNVEYGYIQLGFSEFEMLTAEICNRALDSSIFLVGKSVVFGMASANGT